MSSQTGINKIFLAPMEGQGARIMALQFIKIDLFSAKENKFIFLAPIDGQRVVGRAKVQRLWRCNQSIWISQAHKELRKSFLRQQMVKELFGAHKCRDYGAVIHQFGSFKCIRNQGNLSCANGCSKSCWAIASIEIMIMSFINLYFSSTCFMST